MLTIPKTPAARDRHNGIRRDDPPKFRLSDSPSSSTPSESDDRPFFTDLKEPHSITIGMPASHPIPVGTLITPRSVQSAHRKRSSIRKAPSPLPLLSQLVEEESENTRSSTITISDSNDSVLAELAPDGTVSQATVSVSDSSNLSVRSDLATESCDPELEQLQSDPDQQETYPSDLPMRPHSEPLYASVPVLEPRPRSADPTAAAKNRTSIKSVVKRSTVCQTPRCARPTKAWLARCEANREPPSTRPSTQKSALSELERKEVWNRLWAGSTGHHDGQK